MGKSSGGVNGRQVLQTKSSGRRFIASMKTFSRCFLVWFATNPLFRTATSQRVARSASQVKHTYIDGRMANDGC